MVALNTRTEIDAMADAGAVVAVSQLPHPRWAPTPFPGVLCVSVNDAVVHGIPNDYVLADGDLVSADFGATLRGWTGDAARSFIVGAPRDRDAALIEAPMRRWRRASRRFGRATHWATSDTRSDLLPAMRVTACSPTTAGTGPPACEGTSARRCTRIRTCQTRAGAEKA